MCYRVKLSSSIEEMEVRFQAKLMQKGMKVYLPGNEFNGFSHPDLPIIKNTEPNVIQLSQWGLLPHWAKDPKFANNTLNAKLETLHEKPSFRSYFNNRCLVLIDGFYEYQWLDHSGKKTQKYLLHSVDEQPLALGGLYAGDTFTIITKPAVGLVAEIHNSKLRMPLILDPMFEREWLLGGHTEHVIPELVAVKVAK